MLLREPDRRAAIVGIALAVLVVLSGAPNLSSDGTAVGSGARPGPLELRLAPPAADPRPELTPVWTNITSELKHSPPPRDDAGMVYDSTDGYVVLFGGETKTLPFRYLNDTWTFADNVWTNRTTTHAPSPRAGFMMADDPSDHAVLLFGGTGPKGSTGSFNNQTWEYKAGVWTNVTRPHGPPGRFWGSMSYDYATDTVILFGGTAGYTAAKEDLNDTWSFHAGVWTNVTEAHLPAARDDQAQVNDPADGYVLLFGGLEKNSAYLNDTWTLGLESDYENASEPFEHLAWTNVTNKHAPDVVAAPGLAYDAAAQAVVLYGGTPAEDDYYDTWVYQGGTWTEYPTSPYPPAGTIWGQMTYDALDQVVLMFEGNGYFNATWELTLGIGPPTKLTATISAQPTTATPNQTVAFTASASGGIEPYTFAWNFGDHATSSDQDPFHHYKAVGRYTVTLVVNDSADPQDTVTKELNVTVATSTPGTSGGGLSSDGAWIAVGVAVVAALACVFLVVRRRRRQEAPPPAPPGP